MRILFTRCLLLPFCMGTRTLSSTSAHGKHECVFDNVDIPISRTILINLMILIKYVFWRRQPETSIFWTRNIKIIFSLTKYFPLVLKSNRLIVFRFSLFFFFSLYFPIEMLKGKLQHLYYKFNIVAACYLIWMFRQWKK